MSNQKPACEFREFWIGRKHNTAMLGFCSSPAIVATHKDMLLDEYKVSIFHVIEIKALHAEQATWSYEPGEKMYDLKKKGKAALERNSD